MGIFARNRAIPVTNTSSRRSSFLFELFMASSSTLTADEVTMLEILYLSSRLMKVRSSYCRKAPAEQYNGLFHYNAL